MTQQNQSVALQIVRAIHYPAMWLMSKLRYVAKFTVIGVVLLLPPLYVAFQQYTAATKSLVFNDGEVLGMVYMDPMHDLLDQQERHWVASVARSLGYKDMASVEADSEAKANQLIARLDEVNKKYRHDARFELSVGDANEKVAKRLDDLKAEWAKTLDISKKGTTADINAAHASALGVSNDFVVNFIANFSNLILDPDLDSYWLMDIAVAKGPTIGIDLATATSLALIGLQGDKTDWVYLITSSLTDANGSTGLTETVDLKTAIENTKDFGNNPKVALLKGPFDELKKAVGDLTTVVRDQHIRPVINAAIQVPAADGAAVPAAPKVDMGPLLAASMALFDKLDKLYDDNNVPLKELAQLRVGTYKGERTKGVLFTILAVLLHFYMFAAFYFNINDSVGSLAVATTRMIAGTNERFVTASKDEISDIVDDFNQINTALVEARALQARIADEAAQTQANIVDLLQVVSDASDGNLTVRAHTSAGSLGNVADAFNLLMESLERLVSEVAQQVIETERGVNSIAGVARKMAQGATNQAKEVSAARQLVETVAQQITQVSSNAEGASQATKRTAETAEQGEKAVENVIHGMDALRANVQSGAKKMKNLGDRSMEITSIVGTISRISEQTNMLALNAAIEAARAGEHGRGFSVVADEVRKLAERATNATKDIEKLVKAITAETNETIKAIEQQTQVVEEESRSVAAAGESLRKIRAASDQSAGLVVGISNVSKQQVDQAQKVAKTMEAVSSIANDTQQGADSTVSTINELVRLSADLRKSIGQFRVSGSR